MTQYDGNFNWQLMVGEWNPLFYPVLYHLGRESYPKIPAAGRLAESRPRLNQEREDQDLAAGSSGTGAPEFQQNRGEPKMIVQTFA